MEPFLVLKTQIVQQRMTEGRDSSPEKFSVELSWSLYEDLQETLRTMQQVPRVDLHFVRILESLAVVSVLDIQTVGKHLHSAILINNWPWDLLEHLGRFFASWRVRIAVIKAVMMPDGMRWRGRDENFHLKWMDCFLRPFALGPKKDMKKFVALALHAGNPKLANLVNTENLLNDNLYTYDKVRDTMRHCEKHIKDMRQQQIVGTITHRLKCPYCNENILYSLLFKHVMDIHSAEFTVRGQQCENCHQPVRGPCAVADPPSTYHASVCHFMENKFFDQLAAPGTRVFPSELPFYRNFLRINFGEKDILAVTFEPKENCVTEIRLG